MESLRKTQILVCSFNWLEGSGFTLWFVGELEIQSRAFYMLGKLSTLSYTASLRGLF